MANRERKFALMSSCPFVVRSSPLPFVVIKSLKSQNREDNQERGKALTFGVV